MSLFLAHAPIAWYVVRASGLVAFAALTLSVWLGLATSTRLLPAKRMKSLVGWHQTIAWTGVSMLGLHAGALLFDPTLHFGLAALLVPFAAPWSPAAVAAGVVGGWAMLAIASSFRLKKWIGQKGWRRLHYVSFGAFALALGHALFAGTDLHGVGGPILAAIAAGPVIWLGLVRVLMPRVGRAGPAPRRPALGTGDT